MKETIECSLRQREHANAGESSGGDVGIRGNSWKDSARHNRTSRKVWTGAAVLSLTVMTTFAPARGQSFNIDIGDGMGTPSDTYAAAGMAGVWNTRDESYYWLPLPLVDLNGAPTEAMLLPGYPYLSAWDLPDTTGDDERLLDDGIALGDVWETHTITGLEPGQYRVITYGYNPRGGATTIGVFGATAPGNGTSGAWSGEFEQGVTHTVHTLTLHGSDASITVGVVGNFFGGGAFNGIQLITPLDCNANGIPDEEDVAQGTSPDCNADGYPDECDIGEGRSADCNENAVPDECDIAGGGSADCDLDGVPDDCEDCNGNGLADVCDLDSGTSLDCNANAIPDECDLADGPSEDCNENGLPDECDTGWTQEARITASDASRSDRFGHSVAIHGNVAIIGAFEDRDAGYLSGSAYVFRRVGSIWQEDAKLTASDAADYDRFGGAVDIDGDIAVVGAWLDDGIAENTGAAYVFAWDGGGWFERAKLTPPIETPNVLFGGAVAVSGDRIVVGATGDDAAGDRAGTAYVFTRSGDLWVQQAKLTGSDTDHHDYFGSAVDIGGDRIVVGASGVLNADESEGAAYVFEWDGLDWVEQAKMTHSDPWGDDAFGANVAMHGDTIVVGAPSHSYPDAVRAGAAYVYELDEGNWIERDKLHPARQIPSDGFGTSVATDGTVIVVGSNMRSPDDDHGGTAHTFVRYRGAWVPHLQLAGPNIVAWDRFGGAVGVYGGYILVGAENDDDPAERCGSAYLFTPHGDDTDSNGVPDECEDCNSNGVVDSQDIADGTSADCNSNEIPDDCDIADGTSDDCNDNDIPDECDLAAGTSSDCNANIVPDECDVAVGTSSDCNGNDTPDECDLVSEVSQDCNANDLPDECEIDSDGDGVIDACDACPNDPYKSEPGICGCGVDDNADADDDGIPDCGDQCPNVDDVLFAPGCTDAIPTVSTWGLLVLALLLLVTQKTRSSHYGA